MPPTTRAQARDRVTLLVCVVLSPDILSLLMAYLELEDHAAFMVCTMWRDAWTATSGQRRQLRLVDLPAPKPALKRFVTGMFSMPDGEHLCIRSERGLGNGVSLSVVDKRLGRLPDLIDHVHDAHEDALAITDLGVYAASMGKLWRYTYLWSAEGLVTTVAATSAYVDLWSLDACMCVSAHGVFLREGGSGVVLLDPITLKKRCSFEPGLLHNVRSIAVGGDEVFVSDELTISSTDTRCSIHVFSLSGVHRRVIRQSGWTQIRDLLFANDRLYFIDHKAKLTTITPAGTVLQTIDYSGLDVGMSPYPCTLGTKLYLAGAPAALHSTGASAIRVFEGV